MVQRVVQLISVVLILVGLIGFTATGMSMEASMENATRILGLFPVNALHNVVHILLGIWGLAAARTMAGAISFAKLSGGIYVVLAILGFIIPTTFGLIPIGGNDIYLHALLGVVLLAVGLQASKPATAT